MSESQLARLERAHASIAKRAGAPAPIAIMLGSGLGQLADRVEDAVTIPYGEVEGFPVSTAPGHKGAFVIGHLEGQRVIMMQGRLHLYEGWSPRDIALAVYLLKRLGAQTLIVTNAAGSLNPDYDPGDVMLIEDHMNFTGLNPLVGPNDDEIGLRFPDMSRAYDPDLLAMTKKAADAAGIAVRQGIYAGVLGPSLETSAERRYYRASGSDAVGMSTVTEVIAAGHASLPVIGLSAITNKATGGPDQQPDTIEEVFANAEIAGRKIEAILAKLLPNLKGA
ncbi:purine-nucleoside phosphorylase [Nitratireductor sp. L1-7-SE]|uniref:Purine nucleoside phosphorylase n=1 Tax=Nitratireductor rhodophyticola TaxID=2854036 RepID=A0ABS7RBF1_9HYPH|nr:purine-nucleoside phosphorylase [Nitratireductor rhodophyticola]MBY8918243.1 purine-nucleoside phosphorylase [Nitratireductor rhodophyticola]MBY8920948.1 purine-nucleoside phosphorylase [Nitratireductor rhodophyticola]